MSILLIGLNHKTAPVELRERLAFTDEACSESLRLLVDGEVVREGLIVSTCNRVEVLTETSAPVDESLNRITSFLSETRRIGHNDFVKHLYTHHEEMAVRHLFVMSEWSWASRKSSARCATPTL